jgi:hypothetical protein
MAIPPEKTKKANSAKRTADRKNFPQNMVLYN